MHKTHRKTEPGGSVKTFKEILADADAAGKEIAHKTIAPAMAEGLPAADFAETLFEATRELLFELVDDGLPLDLAKEVVARMLAAAEAEVVEIGLQAHGLTGRLQ